MNDLKNILIVVLFFCSTAFFAQRKQEHEKIKSLKVAFLTEKLDLSSAEAQVFWPVYNDYQKKKEDLRHKERKEVRAKIKEAGTLSEKEAKSLLDKYLSFEKEQEALNKGFLEEISNIITAKKTLLLLRAEDDFKRQLIKQYRHKKGGGGHR